MKKNIGIVLLLAVLCGLFAGCRKETEVLTEQGGELPPDTAQTQDSGPQGGNDAHTPAAPDAIDGDVIVERNTVGKTYQAGDGTVILTATVSVPEITDDRYPEAAAVINEYYRNRQENHLVYAEEELYPYADYAYSNSSLHGEAFLPHSTERFFEVEYNTQGYLSVLTTVVESSGTEYSELSVVAETFEMSHGGLVTGAYLFNCSADVAADRIRNLITTQIAAEIEAGVSGYYEGYEALVESGFQLDRFYLTEEGIVF